MCQSQAQGGRRCSARTGPPFRAAVEAIAQATTLGDREVLRMSTEEAVIAHGSTPEGRDDITAALIEASVSGDHATACWLRTCRTRGESIQTANLEAREEHDRKATAHRRSASAEELMSRFRPTEGADWSTVAAEYESEHPVIMAALREDLAQRGFRYPIEVVNGKIEDGHHRLLAARTLGLDVPYQVLERPGRRDRYWDPETRSHYGPEDDEHGDGQLRY